MILNLVLDKRRGRCYLSKSTQLKPTEQSDPAEIAGSLVFWTLTAEAKPARVPGMQSSWIIFDGAEPDSKVIGLARTLEDVSSVICSSGINLDGIEVQISLTPGAGAGYVSAVCRTYLNSFADPIGRSWYIQQENIVGS